MEYNHAAEEALMNLHVITEKAKVPLACIIEYSPDLPRIEVLVSIAEEYLIALGEAIEAAEIHCCFGSSTSRAT